MADRETEVLMRQPANATGDDRVPECEVVVRRLWADLFGLQPGVEEGNFFQLGGNSAMAVQLVQRIAERFDIALHVVNVFQYPTVRELAQFVYQSLSERAAASAQDDGSHEIFI